MPAIGTVSLVQCVRKLHMQCVLRPTARRWHRCTIICVSLSFNWGIQCAPTTIHRSKSGFLGDIWVGVSDASRKDIDRMHIFRVSVGMKHTNLYKGCTSKSGLQVYSNVYIPSILRVCAGVQMTYTVGSTGRTERCMHTCDIDRSRAPGYRCSMSVQHWPASGVNTGPTRLSPSRGVPAALSILYKVGVNCSHQLRCSCWCW